MSAPGRARIAAAQKAWWAKSKRTAKKAAIAKKVVRSSVLEKQAGTVKEVTKPRMKTGMAPQTKVRHVFDSCAHLYRSQAAAIFLANTLASQESGQRRNLLAKDYWRH
jgi:hypothetical protein